MSRILFLNHPSMGHVSGLLAIALEMKNQGHEVMFFVPELANWTKKLTFLPKVFFNSVTVPNKIRANKIEVVSFMPCVSQAFVAATLPKKYAYEELKAAIGFFTSSLSYYTKGILKKIDEIKPDVLVTDFFFLSSYIVSRVKDIPCVVVYHSGLPFKGSSIPPFGSGLPITESDSFEKSKFLLLEKKIMKKVDERVNKVLRKYNLAPIEPEILRRPYSEFLNLILSHEVIEIPRDNLTSNTFFIGGCYNKKNEYAGLNFPFEKLDSQKYKIFVSLGTVFNNKPEVFKKIIKGLNKPDIQLIISAGEAFEKLNKVVLPGNTLLFRYVPQIELLPKVDLLIGHGGNNSTNEALSFGKPIIVLPVGGEQTDNAIRIEYLMLGLKLDIKTFTETNIFEAVEKIRNNDIYKKNVENAKSQLDRTDGTNVASLLIGYLAKTKKTIEKPSNFSHTIHKFNIHELLNLNDLMLLSEPEHLVQSEPCPQSNKDNVNSAKPKYENVNQ